MGNFQRNPLFRRASSKAAAAARRAWGDTNSAKAIKQIEQAMSTGNSMATGASTAIKYALRAWGKHSDWTEDSISRLANSDFGGVIREVQRYAKLGGATGRLLASMLDTLGPLGSLIKTLVGSPARERKSGLQGDIQSAVEFLDAVAPEVLSAPGRQRARRATGRSTATIAEQIEAAKEFLETQGYEVKSPSEVEREAKKPTYPGGVPTETRRGTPRQIIELQVDGVTRRFPVTHPIVTGAYVECNSSNVHSFSYNYDKAQLMVRFHAPKTPGRGKGSLYAYANVPARKFLALLDAPSKGVWIWDNVRIRGTVSGHQHDYRLVAVTGGYVPRKATYTPEGEKFIGREMEFTNVGTRQRNTMRSKLPDSFARGTPNRGTPNRGR